MKRILLSLGILISINIAIAQNVGIGTASPDASAKLDIVSANGGILIPRVNLTSATDATTISSPATGLMVWNIGATFGTAGFYFNKGTSGSPSWVLVLDSSSSLNDADADPSNEMQTITAGNGLTGGGSGTSITLNTGAGDGITVNADDIAVNASQLEGAGLSVSGNNFNVNVDGTELIINGSDQLEIGNLPAQDADYIWNQNATDQAANFRINGTGQVFKSIATANGDWYMRGGDDHELRDINQANFMGVWGRQNPDRAGLQLGSDGSYIFGEGGNIGIGTITPQKKLEVIGDISLPNSGGGKSIYTWAPNDDNWRIGMHNDNAIVGFSRALATSHVEYATFASGAGQGFAVGDKVTGLSSFETTSSGSGYKSYFRGFVGVGTANIPYQLTLGGTGNVFAVENTASFVAKNSGGAYETYFWPRWSDNIMYMNYGSGGMNLRNNASETAVFIDNDRSIDIKKGVLFNCDDCGSTTTIDGGANWGDLTIQGRVLSTNSNLHLSPPNGFNVVINDDYRAAGGATGGSAGLVVEGVSYLEGGLETDKRYYYFQRYRYCNCYGAGAGSYDMGAWDFCALAQVGFKNNQSGTDEDDDVQCAVYPSGQGGYGEQTDYNTNFTQNHNQRPTWIMYLEAYEDTNGVTCAANCINFRH